MQLLFIHKIYGINLNVQIYSQFNFVYASMFRSTYFVQISWHIPYQSCLEIIFYSDEYSLRPPPAQFHTDQCNFFFLFLFVSKLNIEILKCVYCHAL